MKKTNTKSASSQNERLTERTEAVVRRRSVKKDVLKYFVKFTGKHMWQSLFCNKVAGL